jgi:hypothetical protein
MTKIATTETSLPVTDSERERLEIVLTATLVVSDDGILRFKVMDWTTGYPYGVTPAQVEREVSDLESFGQTVHAILWGEYSPVSGENSLLAR